MWNQGHRHIRVHVMISSRITAEGCISVFQNLKNKEKILSVKVITISKRWKKPAIKQKPQEKQSYWVLGGIFPAGLKEDDIVEFPGQRLQQFPCSSNFSLHHMHCRIDSYNFPPHRLVPYYQCSLSAWQNVCRGSLSFHWATKWSSPVQLI